MREPRLFVRWTVASAIGMALGFLAFLQTLMFLGFGFDFQRHWSEAAVEALGEADPANAERLLRVGDETHRCRTLEWSLAD